MSVFDAIARAATGADLGSLLNQAVGGVGAANAGTIAGTEAARKKAQEDEERAMRRRKQQQDDAVAELSMQEGNQRLAEGTIRLAGLQDPSQAPEVRQKLFLQEHEPNGFEVDGHRFATQAEMIAYMGSKARATEPRFTYGYASGGGGGTRSMTPNQQATSQMHALQGLAAGMRTQGATFQEVVVALGERFPDVEEGLRAYAADRAFGHPKTNEPTMTLDQSWSHLEESLDAPSRARWRTMSPIQKRNAADAFARGQDPFAPPTKTPPPPPPPAPGAAAPNPGSSRPAPRPAPAAPRTSAPTRPVAPATRPAPATGRQPFVVTPAMDSSHRAFNRRHPMVLGDPDWYTDLHHRPRTSRTEEEWEAFRGERRSAASAPAAAGRAPAKPDPQAVVAAAQRQPRRRPAAALVDGPLTVMWKQAVERARAAGVPEWQWPPRPPAGR